MKEELAKYITFVKESYSHYIFKCPFCGDSKKADHGHMYVSKTDPVYHCVRCGQGGHISSLISHLGANDIVVPLSLDSGKQSRKISGKTISFNIKKEYEDTILGYMQARLNLSYIPDELNMVSYADYLKIMQLTKHNFLFDKGVPFLSSKSKKLILRVLDKPDYRYFVYSLDGSGDSDCYIIQNKRRMSSFRKHKTVVIAEGIFDIINQYMNRFIDTPDDAIYAASLTRTMMSASRVIRSLTLTYLPDVIVLADNDTPDEYYKNNVKHGSLQIWRNRLHKDFGEKEVEPYLSYSEAF